MSMKLSMRILALLLAAVMMAGALAGCGSMKVEDIEEVVDTVTGGSDNSSGSSNEDTEDTSTAPINVVLHEKFTEQIDTYFVDNMPQNITLTSSPENDAVLFDKALREYCKTIMDYFKTTGSTPDSDSISMEAAVVCAKALGQTGKAFIGKGVVVSGFDDSQIGDGQIDEETQLVLDAIKTSLESSLGSSTFTFNYYPAAYYISQGDTHLWAIFFVAYTNTPET